MGKIIYRDNGLYNIILIGSNNYKNKGNKEKKESIYEE